MSKVIQRIIKVAVISSCYLMAILSVKSVSAANPENVNYQVNVAPSLVVEVPTGNNVVLDLNPNSKTFDYKDLEVIVRTNNVTGYQLKLTTADNNTYLTRDTSSDTTTIGPAYMYTLAPTTPASTGYSESDFKNCLDTNTDCMNKWGYKVTSSDTDPSLVTTNYFPFATDTLLATNHYATNGDSTTMRFAAKIDWNQMAGTYENTLVFTATATYAEYTINYYDGVGNQIATQSNPYNTSATIPINPTYSGGATGPTRKSGLSKDTYTFLGWCDQQPGGETSEGYFAATTCPSGHQHPAGSTITIDPEQYETNLSLYAYWDPTTFAEAYQAAGKSQTSGYYTMQDMTSGVGSICAAVTAGEKIQLKDTRGKTSASYYNYWVAKLKDEKCWMIQNLKLGNELSTSESLTLTPANSNVTSNYTLSGKVAPPGEFTTFVTCPTSTCEDRHNDVTFYNDNNAYYCTPISGDTTQYVGCYYNWYSATASSGTSAITPVGTSVGYKDVDQSICPRGWYLPSGGGMPFSGSTSDRPNSDFNVLYNNYPSAGQLPVPNPTDCGSGTGNTACDNPTGASLPGLLLAGGYGSSGAYLVTQYGFYWSRSAYSKGVAYVLFLNSLATRSQYYNNKYDGMPVRCLAYSS